MLLGIDLGTSGIKAVVLAPYGEVAASSTMEYASLYPQPGWVEQDPHTWLDTLVNVINSIWKENPFLAKSVEAIGFSGQMHGAVFTDQAGKCLRPAIIWADGRSRKQVDRINNELGCEEIACLTGSPIFTGFMLPSILWVQENEPQVWQDCRKVLLPKDYLRSVFTGEYHAEPSDASSTGLVDINRRKWSLFLAERFCIDPDRLPEIIESGEITGTLLPEMAEKLGLTPGIPVVCGGSDQACQALGNGIISPGDVSCTIGTGGQIFAPLASPGVDRQQRLHLFCHAVPGMWHLEAATLSAGLSLRWLRDITGSMTYSQMADSAMQIPAGAEGLLFAPFLQGERTPYMDAGIRGGFVGLSVRHGLPHMIRALMEGVVFSLRTGLDLICEKSIPFEQITASGGACRHPLWLQLMADIFNLPVVTARYAEPAAAGAAMLAGIGTGVFGNAREAVQQVNRHTDPLMPDNCHCAAYLDIYKQYLKLYDSLRQFKYRQ